MLKWRGSLSFKIYNKDKPTKYGIKAYIVADLNFSYCWNMDMYCRQRKPSRDTVFSLLGDACFYSWHHCIWIIFITV